MRRGRTTRWSRATVSMVVAMLAVATVPGTTAGAAAPAATAAGEQPPPGLTQTLAPIDVNGGYVAAGTGLRNRGYGSIHLSGVPANSDVERAYLYWYVDAHTRTPGATFPSGRVDGTPITGTLVGAWHGGTCTNGDHSYAYRADVTALVHGNGDYRLSSFRSTDKDGADPFLSGWSTAPLIDGASLVVVYRNDAFPRTRVVLADGAVAPSTETVSSNLSWGFPATNPVPEVRTTFIGGGSEDRAANLETGFNGFVLPKVVWDGSDPQAGGTYSHGSLWDTETVSVGRRVRPGDTGAVATLARGGCTVWISQVLSIGFDGSADTDGDGLLDGWEANGNDGDGNGTYDVNLQSMGASVVHKDVFVEMDTMGAETTCPCHLPLGPDLDRIVAAFATSPYADNPDGKPGIAIHLDAGPYRDAKYDLGGGNLVPHDDDLNPVGAEFSPIKAANFSPLRAKTFHYMVWAHGYDGGSSSGLSFGIRADSFIVTLGRWGEHGSSDAKVGTFIHELGHNLGLGHGGNDLFANYKPNYPSVMNYFFQVSGVPQSGGRPALFSYSRYKLPSLVETNLAESAGVATPRGDGYLARYFCPDDTVRQSATPLSGPVDWNCDGAITANVSTDVNNDNATTTLGGWRDWGNLYFTGGTIGADGPGAAGRQLEPAPAPPELTYEESLRLRR
jgi:hypothetical protein